MPTGAEYLRLCSCFINQSRIEVADDVVALAGVVRLNQSLKTHDTRDQFSKGCSTPRLNNRWTKLLKN